MTLVTGLRQLSKVLAAAVLVGCICQPANANIIITVQSVTAHPGDIGDSLDVLLTNFGPGMQDIAGDNFEISVAGGSGITFTQVNISTLATYIYMTSGAGPTISDFTPNPGPGQIIDGSDFDGSLAGTGTDVGAGATFGIGHVLFDVASNALPGLIPVTLNIMSGSTSLSDDLGAGVSFDPVNGSITIPAATSTPEPSTLLVAMLSLPAMIALRRLR